METLPVQQHWMNSVVEPYSLVFWFYILLQNMIQFETLKASNATSPIKVYKINILNCSTDRNDALTA